MHLCPRRVRLSALFALMVGVLAVFLSFSAGALAGPTVKVRVEGESGTLLPLKTVTLSAPEPVSGCPANSVAAAINLAVEGNWDHGEAEGGGGDFTKTILGETLSFEPESQTWAEWVNDKWGGGICTDLLSEGDEVLMIADKEPEPSFAPTVLPLVVTEAPSTVQAGAPFTVKVSAVHTPAGTFAEPGEGTPEPAGGVSVSGGGASGVSTAGGVATLTLASVGTFTLRASETGFAASAPFTICVHNGNDGSCGTQGPTGFFAENLTVAVPYKGPYALVAQVSAPLDGHVYAHGKGPRLLEGKVLSHSAVSSIGLELRREYKGRCSAFEGVKARFQKATCGTGKPFAVSSNGLFSYLLPSALAPGRYVLDVQAVATRVLCPVGG
jgi:hypothetical protein